MARLEVILQGTDDNAISQRMAASVFLIRIINAAIAIISQVLLARWMGSYEYGIFVAVWTAVLIIEALIGFGMPTAALRFVSKYREEKRYELLWGAILGSTGFGIIASLSFSCLALLALFFGPQFLSEPYVMPAIIAAICIPGMVVAGISSSISRSFNWTLSSFLPTYILRPLSILAVFWLVFTFGFGATAITAMWSALLAAYFSNLLQILNIHRKLKRILPYAKPQFKLKYWLIVALPIFLIESFYVLLTSVDVLFVSWLTKPEDTAIYYASTKILALVHFVYFAVRAASSHRYSAYHASGNRDALAHYMSQSISWTFWPSLGLGLVMVLLGKYFLLLFGSEFVAGTSIIWIFVIGIVIRSSVGPSESLLVMTGNQNDCARIYILALLVNIVLNYILIPIYGLPGAAIATSCAMIVETASLYLAVKRKLGINAFILSSFNMPKDADKASGYEQ